MNEFFLSCDTLDTYRTTWFFLLNILLNTLAWFILRFC